MHVETDFNWFLQFIVLAIVGACSLLYLVRNTASRYFMVDSSFDSSAPDYPSLDRQKRENMAEAGGGASEGFDSCAVCGLLTKKQCARCKMVKYCSEACQKSHWNSEHKTKCKDLQLLYKANYTKPKSTLRGRKASVVPAGGCSEIHKQSNNILFPYEEFLEFFNWDKPGYPPCGLINCGNSCFANVVLQCLAYTRPLVAYLLERGHRRECQRDDWCFLCEFQLHVERASRSLHPFSPMNILSRLPNIGGNLGYGKQEDAHEFMRFAIDMMQSVCLDEFGGEKSVHPSYQETTLLQHIFGGRLRSQVICAECNNVSNQFENMMDLTVEIHGDAGSLEECLDQFTAKEWLHGDNMYKCDGCNAYVMAWKRLTIQRSPNILTVALKRFQSGRFGKLNKRVTFPERLDISPYMSELEDGRDVYKLYAVIVHVDMLNASYFGHYICYVKDFGGNWYRIDDCKVAGVDVDEVLSQGAYMLLYSRICARPSCLLPTELSSKEESETTKIEVDSSPEESAESLSDAISIDNPVDPGQSLSTDGPGFNVKDMKMVSDLCSSIDKDVDLPHSEGLLTSQEEVASPIKHDAKSYLTDASQCGYKTPTQTDAHSSDSSSSLSDTENAQCGSKSNGKLTVKSSADGNCTFEEASSEVRDRINSTDSASMHVNVGYGNGASSSSSLDIRNVAKKSDVVKSAANCKPLFAPGFLGKNLRNKYNKLEKRTPSAVEDMTTECHMSNHVNKVAKPRLLCENDDLLKEDRHYINENVDTLKEDRPYIDENGKVFTGSGIYKSLGNGESAIEI